MPTIPPPGHATHGLEHYVFDEHYTGRVWVNGKPIFRQIFPVTAERRRTTLVVSGIFNEIEQLMPTCGFMAETTDEHVVLARSILVNDADEVEVDHRGTNLNGRDALIVLEYTKP